MLYALLADAIVVLHLSYVLFVVAGQVLILVGWPLGWRWIRNLRFRLLHFLAIAIVAVEALFQVWCPLTTWEYQLRAKAGQLVADEVDPERISFVGRIARDVLFFAPEDVSYATLRVVYYAFAGLVLATLFCVPPRRAARSRPRS